MARQRGGGVEFRHLNAACPLGIAQHFAAFQFHVDRRTCHLRMNLWHMHRLLR